MAKQPATNLFTYFGFVIWGDLGQLTLYRNKQGKVVVFQKTWPDKPPSDLQNAQRARFTAAAEAWADLSDANRAQWELASKRACLCMHGYDLFVHWQMMQDDAAITTLERQTNTTLLP